MKVFCRRTASRAAFSVVKYVGIFLYGGCVCIFVSSNIATVVKCKQKSMYPTINKTSKDDYVIVEMISRHRGKLKKNDVITLRHPYVPDQLICKRIALVEGDILPENYRRNFPNSSLVVRKGHIFVEGDNSSTSSDSRSFGPVSLGLVMGKVIFRIWPFSQIGWIK